VSWVCENLKQKSILHVKLSDYSSPSHLMQDHGSIIRRYSSPLTHDDTFVNVILYFGACLLNLMIPLSTLSTELPREFASVGKNIGLNMQG